MQLSLKYLLISLSACCRRATTKVVWKRTCFFGEQVDEFVDKVYLIISPLIKLFVAHNSTNNCGCGCSIQRQHAHLPRCRIPLYMPTYIIARQLTTSQVAYQYESPLAKRWFPDDAHPNVKCLNDFIYNQSFTRFVKVSKNQHILVTKQMIIKFHSETYKCRNISNPFSNCQNPNAKEIVHKKL